jgi:hypothetical protein
MRDIAWKRFKVGSKCVDFGAIMMIQIISCRAGHRWTDPTYDLLNPSNQLPAPGRHVGARRSSPTVMATNYQDLIVLFGDSLTQMSWGPELGGIGARLAGASTLIMVPTLALYIVQRRRFVRTQTRCS